MPTPSTPGYDADLKAVAAIAEVDPGSIAGWSLMTWGAGGEVRLAHSACCTSHAHDHMVWALNNMPTTLVECSGEQ